MSINQNSRWLFWTLNKNSVAIDCGANVGMVTAKLAKTGAKVYAFEPNIFAFKKLNSRFSDYNNVVCLNQAVLDHNGQLDLFFHENSDENEEKWSKGSSLLKDKNNVNKDKKKQVEVIDFVEFIEKLNKKIDFIKMDVEGVEFIILKALINSPVINRVKKVYVETHEEKIPEIRKDAAEVRELIKKRRLSRKIKLNWI